MYPLLIKVSDLENMAVFHYKYRNLEQLKKINFKMVLGEKFEILRLLTT
jgi:hypothetical protein